MCRYLSLKPHFAFHFLSMTLVANVVKTTEFTVVLFLFLTVVVQERNAWSTRKALACTWNQQAGYEHVLHCVGSEAHLLTEPHDGQRLVNVYCSLNV